MGDTAGDYLCERLMEWGVTTIYGFPGDGINGIMGALRRHQDRLRFIQIRHEEMAAFMACGHAKFTGDVGVCMATSGPGAIHLLNGLYDAKLDHQPVVAIVGQTFVRALGGSFQQEVKLLQLYSDVASAYCEQVNEPGSMRHVVDRAFRIAQAERTVTCVIVPADVQDMDAVPSSRRQTHTMHSGVGYWPGRMIPEPEQLQAAADILNAGKKVAMLVGAGALHATDEVVARRRRAGRRRRQGVARQGGRAGRRAVLHRRDRAARHQTELGHDAGLPTRCSWSARASPTRSSCPRRVRRAAVQIDLVRADAVDPVPDGAGPRRRQQADAGRAAAAAATQGGPLLAGGDRQRRAGLVAPDGRPGQPRTTGPAESDRRRCSPRCLGSCRTTRSCPATPAPRRTGMPGTSGSGAA